MKKSLLIKIFAVILMSITFSIFIFNYNVNATSIESEEHTLEEILNSEEKIMMYDATTGETTEVDMEELKQEITLSKNSSKSGCLSLDSYDPLESTYKPKTAFYGLARLRLRRNSRKGN